MESKPVLLICFNRPEHTRRVLKSILDAQVRELYVFQDGARENNAGDREKCAAVRQLIEGLAEETGIGVHTNFAQGNLGCGAGPATAVNWFFSQVDAGIVMEDDCLPHPDFFPYCNELLERYRNCPGVMYIGSTLYDDRWKCKDSYGFSHYMITGAWASWSRAWKGFDLDLHQMNARRFRRRCKKLLYSVVEADWWYFKVLEIQRDREKKSYWDYQMQIHLFENGGLTVHPKYNLVSNIGFDEAGTHTLNNADGRGNKQVFAILPLTHPTTFQVDTKRDYECFAKTHSQGWLKDTTIRLYKRMLFDRGMWKRLLLLYKRLKHS